MRWKKQVKNKSRFAQSIDKRRKSGYNRFNNRLGKGEAHVYHRARFLLLL
jgi:hypothetical protein